LNLNPKLTTSSLLRDLMLTLLTFGLWNLYVQFRQIHETNILLGREEIPSFTKVAILTLLTLGLYFCYFEYKLTKELHLLNFGERRTGLEYAIGFLSFIGLWFFVDLYQQDLINRLIEKKM